MLCYGTVSDLPEYSTRMHPVIIVENTFRTAIALLIILFISTKSLDMPIIAAIVATALILLLLFYYRQWRLTFIHFGKTDIVVERKTLFKLKKTLPYSRIASINLNRGILNRLSGTSKLMININSGYNAIVPEASLTFERHLADRIRDNVSDYIYRDEASPLEESTSTIHFTLTDVIFHGLFSVPTQQSIIGGFFFIYSIIQQYYSTVSDLETNSGTAVISMFLFFIFLAVPAIRHMIYYYGFKVHRHGETIYLEHGLIRTYKTSFKISRVNAITIKTTLFSRLLGRSCIEAEVVGIASSDSGGNTRPLISLLANDRISQQLLQELVPEFVYERQGEKQPIGAKNVLIIRGLIASAILISIMIYPSILAYNSFASNSDGLSTIFQYMLPITTSLVLIGIAYSTHISLKVRELDIGKELFTFVNGLLDREIVIMNYDKVQMIHVNRGPISRQFNVAKGKIFMLSSTGTNSISSGLFSETSLERIGDIIMERSARTLGRYT
ncbi:MAG: PH domain-containing protein [Euryarchaeota archaeon]|nr:PH domain-containing protein [Euryarchaeota archaeon]